MIYSNCCEAKILNQSPDGHGYCSECGQTCISMNETIQAAPLFDNIAIEAAWMEVQESDAHSCTENSEYGTDGNKYCKVCGKMTRSADQIENEHELY